MAQYSTRTISPNPDQIYFDVTATNFGDFGSDPPTFYYNEKRAIPFLKTPEDYYLSVIRFTCETGTLPVFIPTINPPDKNQIYKGGAATLHTPQFSAGQETIYQVGMSVSTDLGAEIFATQNVMWSPQDLNASMPPYNNGMTYQDWTLDGSKQNLGNYTLNTDKYYNCYSYNYFMTLIQNAISLCYAKLGVNYNSYYSSFKSIDTCLLGSPTRDSSVTGGYDYTPLFPVCPQISWNSQRNTATIVVDTAGWTSNISKKVGDLAAATKLISYTSAGINLVGSTNFFKMPAQNSDVVSQRTSNVTSLAFVAPPTINSGPATYGSSQYFVQQTPNTILLNVGSVNTTNQNGASLYIAIPISLQTTGSVSGYGGGAFSSIQTASTTITHSIANPSIVIYKNGILWRTLIPTMTAGGATSISFSVQFQAQPPIGMFGGGTSLTGNTMNVSQGSYLTTYQATIPLDYGINSYSFSFQADLTTIYGTTSQIFSFSAINLTTNLLYNTTTQSNYLNNTNPVMNASVDWAGQPGTGLNNNVTILPTGYKASIIDFISANPPVPNPATNVVGTLQSNLNPLTFSPLNFNLYFNPALYQILSGFSAIYQKPWTNIDNAALKNGYLPPNSVNSTKHYFPCAYKLNFFNLGNTNTQTYSSSYTNPNLTYLGASFEQEYSSVHNISPLTSLVFCSDTLPIVASQVSTPLVYANGNIMTNGAVNAAIQNVITDLTSNDGSYRPFLVYEPTAQYRLISLVGNQPLDTFDLSVFYRTRSGQLVPFTLASGSTVTIKLAFIKKTSVVS